MLSNIYNKLTLFKLIDTHCTKYQKFLFQLFKYLTRKLNFALRNSGKYYFVLIFYKLPGYICQTLEKYHG
jgi:hypothetical protein